ncbi:protein kinase [Streptomyces collinus]|uniref:protein kinase domain-containing protein n=1 Tax=Streptomyces collinus TaxID=42684 RepID=UPI003693085F
MPSPLTHDDPQAFGRYRPIARLGSGGMGTVYLARTAGGRTVALKTMHAGIASDPASRARFRLETDAARVVGERFGAGVVDADPRAETPWLATEYVLGPPLDEAVELCGPLPEASVRALGAALCGALGQLHASDVVHRDLKPSNVLVTAYGPKVIDFGIARAAGDDRLTRVGVAVGTPAFMSPEQASGQEHTAAGDVFALAGLLVFAATGRPPFGHGQTADLLYRVRYAEPELSGVPGGLVPVLAQCLDKNPFRRPTTSWLASHLHDGDGEFADHLPDGLLADIGRRAAEVWQITPQRLPAPIGEPEIASTAVPTRWSRRRLLSTGGGAAVAVAAGTAGALTWGGWPGDRKSQPAPGPSNSLLPEKRLDSLWQIQVADPDNPYFTDDMAALPSQPRVVGDLVVLMAGMNLNGVAARTGRVDWQSDDTRWTWQTTSDAERILLVTSGDDHSSGLHTSKAKPLALTWIDPVTGTARDPFVQFTDLDYLPLDQALCVADGVAYLVAGRGKYSLSFLASQSWYVVAVNVSTGRRLWTAPLSPRRQDPPTLYVLAAEVVGGRLVAMQEATDGSVHAVVRDTRTGTVLWDRKLDGVDPDSVRQPLVTDGQHLYVGAGRLKALRLGDGGVAWDSGSERPGRTHGLPALSDGTVYAVEKGLGLVAFDAASGRVKWQEKGGGKATKADLAAAPVVGSAYVYSKRGTRLWATGLSSHAPAHSYRTTGDRFLIHEKAGEIIALGGHFLAAFPLR